MMLSVLTFISYIIITNNRLYHVQLIPVSNYFMKNENLLRVVFLHFNFYNKNNLYPVKNHVLIKNGTELLTRDK